MWKSRTLPVLAALAASFLITAGAAPARAGASNALQGAFAKQGAALRLADALLACDRAALLAPGPVCCNGSAPCCAGLTCSGISGHLPTCG
jgi:hypothetical protein